MLRPSVPAFALLISVLPACHLTPALCQPAPRSPAVLFTGSYWGGCGFEVARKLSETGFALNAGQGLLNAALSWEKAQSYNAIVATGLGQANADGTLSEKTTQSLDTLRRFLDAGGGVLLVASFGQMAAEAGPQEAFLKPLGLTPLFDETPTDAEATVATAWRIPFAYTTGVAPSPLTEGVEGLWYPVPPNRIGAQNHTTSFTVDASWTVVLSGSPTSATHKRAALMDNTADTRAVGTYSRSVPLVAAREVGKGRLVFVGITAEYLLGAHAMTTLEGIVLERGLLGKPSGGYKLLENALRWLVEPSAASTELGGAADDPALRQDPHKTRFGTPYFWPDQVSFPGADPALPGVIGARTSYSSGKATAEEWVSRAKAAGLAFIVFLEEFASLTAEEFGNLKADCDRLSSPEFAAIPGFTVDDEVGNHYFYFGSAFPYPDKSLLSEDGTALRARDRELSQTDPYIKGQLAMTTLDYAYTTCAFKLTAGNYLFGRDAAPFADFFSDWNATGVVTSENGKLAEDATQDYLRLIDSGQGPLPLALHLMDSPEQLEAVPWRTVLRLPPNGGNVIAGVLEKDTKVRDYFNLWHFYPDNPSRIYVTSGPEIESWCYTGPRDYEGNTPGDFVWQNYRWVLRGKVKSDVGLREVAVYDGPVLFRRYVPREAAGQAASLPETAAPGTGRQPVPREFEFTLDLTHDQQHNLVLIATDVNGNRAISGEQWDRNHRAEEFMCSDRNNQLSYGYLTNKAGTGIMIGGNQSLATPYKRIANGNISPSGTFRNDALLGAPAFDGAAGGEPEVFEEVLPQGTQEPLRVPNVCESIRLMATGDVHIGEGRREHSFADNIGVYNVWHTLWRTEPVTQWTVTRRNHFFQINPDSPLAVFLWRMDFRLLKDLPNAGFHIGHMYPGQAKLWALRGSDGSLRAGTWEDTPRTESRYLTAPFGKGAYAAFVDSPLGGAAVFPLTDGLQAIYPLPQRSRYEFVLPQQASPQKQGEAGHVELLLLGIPRLTDSTRSLPAASTEVVERFYHEFGLDGGPGGYEVKPQTGVVLNQRYILALDGAAEQGFSGQLTGNLVSSLPITVAGLHDHWSAYLYDRGLGKARPIGMFEGKAWATVSLTGALDLFVGHPVTVSDDRLFIQVTQTGESVWRIEVHNPTDGDITATLRVNPHFDPLAVKKIAQEQVTVPAGSSVFRDL